MQRVSRVVQRVGKNGITAKVICDSINNKGNRLTTFELEYPRFIHAEFMTHRMLSKNSASSRAIPVSKMIKNIQHRPAIPVYWGKNRRGMQATVETDSPITITSDNKTEAMFLDRNKAWIMARDSAIKYAKAYADAGYHKQNVNRLIEPFQMIKVVCSGTEFDNFFWLRYHEDAQPDIKELADVMYEVREQSEPTFASEDDGYLGYHLPYITDEIYEECETYTRDTNKDELPLDLALKVSASCCAQVSYRTTDTDIQKALRIYSQLVESEPIHASPFEHQARPITVEDMEDFLDQESSSGITHIAKDGLYWSGNFRGWIQHRHEIPNNTCWKYD
jgi:hypothetical protein